MGHSMARIYIVRHTLYRSLSPNYVYIMFMFKCLHAYDSFLIVFYERIVRAYTDVRFNAPVIIAIAHLEHSNQQQQHVAHTTADFGNLYPVNIGLHLRRLH